jgi:hypothetical protein
MTGVVRRNKRKPSFARRLLACLNNAPPFQWLTWDLHHLHYYLIAKQASADRRHFDFLGSGFACLLAPLQTLKNRASLCHKSQKEA